MMTIKDQILVDLESIKSPNVLNQIFEYMQLIKQSYSKDSDSNKNRFLEFTGLLSDKEAEEISLAIDSEFSSIECDW